MARYMYTVDFTTDTALTGSELDELQQLVVDFITPETTLWINVDLVDQELDD